MSHRSMSLPHPVYEEYEEVVQYPLTYSNKKQQRKAKLRTRIEIVKRRYAPGE